MVQQIENLSVYHQVVADANKAIFNSRIKKEKEEAKRLILDQIIVAFIQVNENKHPEKPFEQLWNQYLEHKFSEMKENEILGAMAYWQSKANMKSVQSDDGGVSKWQRMRINL